MVNSAATYAFIPQYNQSIRPMEGGLRRRRGQGNRKTYYVKTKNGGYYRPNMKAYATKSSVKRMISLRQEKKYHDVQFNGTAASSAAGSVDLSAIASGDTDIQRDGDQIYAKSLELRLNVTKGDTTNLVRLLIVQAFIDNGLNTFSATDVLSDPNTYPNQSMLDYDNWRGQQFRVVAEKYVNIPSDANSGDWCEHFDLRAIPRKKITFTGAATTGCNHLYLIYSSDSGAAAHPAIYGYTRLIYTDS